MKTFKKHVSIKGLLDKIRNKFSKLPNHVTTKSKISDTDCLMAAIAMFQLKSPSLLDFDEKVHDSNVVPKIANH